MKASIAARLISVAFLTAAGLGACTPKKDEPGVKIVRRALLEDVKIADPAQANDTISAEVMGDIFEGLVSFSYLGPMGQMEPCLAESLPKFSDNNKTLTFRIRKGVRFQDDAAFEGGKGRELVAADFEYSFRRIADPKLASSNWWMFSDAVEGFDEWRTALENFDKAPHPDAKAAQEERAKLWAQPIKGFESSEPTKLVVHLKRPYPQLLQILGMTHASAVAREVVEKYGPEIGNHPVGTGAYQLKEWIRGSRITLVRNPNYRADFYPTVGTDEARNAGLLHAAGRPLPFANQLQFDILKEEQPRWLKLMKGEIDAGNIPKDNFGDAIDGGGNLKSDLAGKGIKLHKEMSLTSWWLEFNMKDPVIGKNLKLRQALAMAFDRAKALQILTNNRGVLASSPLPPSLEGGSDVPPYKFGYNVEAAKAALAAAGYPEGKALPELTFDLRGPSTTERQMGELIAENFGRIGVPVRVLANSFPEALEKLKTSHFQMTISGWAGDYPDPENFLQLFTSANAAPGPNSSNFNNKEYDRLYNVIRTQLPGPARRANIKKMIEILQAEMPLAPYFHALNYSLSWDWLKNYRPHLLLYGMGKFLDVDLNERAQGGRPVANKN